MCSSLPPFVTHGPHGAEARDMSAIWALALEQGHSSTLQQEDLWLANGWLPSKTEMEQCKSRAKRARETRLQKIRYDLKQLTLGLRTEFKSLVKAESAKQRLYSPVGAAADELSQAIGQLPNTDFSRAELATLSCDELEHELNVHTSVVLKLNANVEMDDSISVSGSSVSSTSVNTAQIDKMLDETGYMEEIMSQLADKHQSGVITTLNSFGMGCGDVRLGSVMINTALPTHIADWLKEWLKVCISEDDPFFNTLQEAGVLAIGDVYEPRKKQRVLFLPGLPQEFDKGTIATKMLVMMDDLIDEQEGKKASDRSLLTVYFDTDHEPKKEICDALIAKFQLLVLSEARKTLELKPELVKMLDNDERRRRQLKEAEEASSKVYYGCVMSASRPLSEVNGWPGFCASSSISATSSLCGQIEESYAQDYLRATPSLLIRSSRLLEHTPDNLPCLPASKGTPIFNVNQQENDWEVVRPPKEKASAHLPTRQDKSKTKPKKKAIGRGPVMPRMRESDFPAGDPFEELTRPQAPSATLLSELEGKEPAAYRSRLPAISAGAALNEHLACVALEIDGLQPFEIFDGPSTEERPSAHHAYHSESDSEEDSLDADSEEFILDIGDCKLKERHASLYPHEKWFSCDESSTAYKHWVQQLNEHRLLLDDQVIEDLSQKIGRGQKLQYVGSTDGNLIGAVALHVYGSDADASKKQVMDQLVEWLAKVGENFVFYDRPLRMYVHWGRTPPHITENDWEALLTLLRESFRYVEYTSADWLLLIATAHVFAPVTVFDYLLARGVRFVKGDAMIQGGKCGYISESQLPASSDSWLVLGLLDNGHFVRCRRKQLNSEVMLQMIKEREEVAVARSAGPTEGFERVLDQLRCHAEKYDKKLSDAQMREALSASANDLDKAIKGLRLPPRSAPDAVIIQGPSGTGKSTWINFIAGKTMYDDTAPAQPGKWCEPALAVLGRPLHTIGRGAEAETLHVSGTVIKTDDDATPYLEVLDTPGMFDTRGPLIEVVNAIFIAKCMPRFRTLRIVIMVREDTLKGKAEGFANTVETMAKLFAKAGGPKAVKKHVMLWVNPHKPKGETNDAGVVSKLNAIRGARADIADFIRMLIQQSNLRKAVRVLEYDPEPATGEEREAILQARQHHYPDLDPNEEVNKAIVDYEEIVEQIMVTIPMKNPGDKCGLPLTDQASAEIIAQVLKLQDSIALGCQLHNYTSVRRYLDVLRSLCEHMRVASSELLLMPQNKYAEMYKACLTAVEARVKETCSKSRMKELSKPIGQPIPLSHSLLHAICLSMRAAAAASVLESHINGIKESSVEMCCETVCIQLQLVTEASCQLLQDHFIEQPVSSDVHQAHRVFGEQLPHVLKTLQLIRDQFGHEASFTDGAAASFARIEAEAIKCLEEHYTKVLQAIETQTRKAEEQISISVIEATDIASRYFEKNAEDSPAMSTAQASSPFDAAADALEIVKIAEEALMEFFPDIKGKRAASRNHAINVVHSQSVEAMEALEVIVAVEQNKEFFTEAMQVCREKILVVLVNLLFLVHARSSRLSNHCDGNDDRARLDACYTDLVNKVVKLHGDLINGVLEAAKHDADEFVKTISDYQAQIELSMELVKLSDVETIQLDYTRSVQPYMRWHQLKDSSTKLTSRIESVLVHYGSFVEMRLKAYSDRVSRASDAEVYNYSEHANDLQVLEKARWCDAILEESIIESAIAKVWQAFERHILRLKAAIDELRDGNHKEARTLLVQTHGMAELWIPFLFDQLDSKECTAGSTAQSAKQSAYSAVRIKAVHDEVEAMANKLIADKCEKVRTEVIHRPGPRVNPARWDWWMDLSIRDAQLSDILGHLNSLLDMAKHLLTVSQGQQPLDEWLKLRDLEKLRNDCLNRGRELICRLVTRVSNFFGAVGLCMAKDMDEGIAVLRGETVDQLCGMSSEGASDDGKSEDTPRDWRIATRDACREIKDILHFLSSPSDYPLIFQAARDPKYAGSFNFDDRVFFRDLERQYQTSYSDCLFHFGNEETKPEARQKAIFIYSIFDRILPPDEEFRGFKKIFSSHHNLLVQADQVAKREMSKELKSRLLVGDFSEETRQLMLDSQALGKDDERARGPYIANCNVIVCRIQELLDAFDLATMHLKVPDPNFNVQTQLVKPWNQLQAARINVSDFIKDASAKTELNLDQRLQQALAKFERVFKEEVLVQHARMFDMGDYRGAEGNEHAGLMRVSILVLGIQMAHGGELGQVAKDAYDQERRRQKDALAQLHVQNFKLNDAVTLAQEGSFDKQVCIIEEYLKESHARAQAINEIPSTCELIVEYKQAAKLIHDSVRQVISQEFIPLFQDQFLDLSKDHINYLDNLLARFMLAPYKEDALRMLPTSSSGGSPVDVAKQNIATFRDMHENVSQEALSSLEIQKSDSIESIKSKVQHKADMLRSISSQHPKYAQIVHEFNGAAKEAIQRAEKMIGSHPTTIPPGEFEAVFAEVRERCACSKGLKGVMAQEEAVKNLNMLARDARNDFEDYLLTSPQSPLLNSQLSNDAKMDNMLFAQVQTYSSLVIIAPANSSNLDAVSQQAQSSQMPDLLGQQSTKGKEVMAKLRAKIQSTVDMCTSEPATPSDLSLKYWALQTLQRWEPLQGVVGSQVSIFDVVTDLEAMLFKEDTISDKQVAQPIRHEECKRKVYADLNTLIASVASELGRCASFVADQDQPLDPKPFELVFSQQMDELINYVGPELKSAVQLLKKDIDIVASGSLSKLEKMLADNKLKEADQLLQDWKFIEPLTQSKLLSGLLSLPGAAAFECKLQGHVHKLVTQAKVAVQTTEKTSEGWQKLISRPVLLLGRCGSCIPRAADFCKTALDEVLDAIEMKFGAEKMQQLATELRERDEQLGQEIIRSSKAFSCIQVGDFNRKTQRDISVVKKLYIEKNGPGSEQVWDEYEIFKLEYDKLIDKCTDTLFPQEDPLGYLVEYSKRKAGLDKGWYGAQKHMPHVLAGIFAWWSMSFFKELRSRNPHLVYDPQRSLQPNNVQVVCILKLLGGSSKIVNHLAEVPTGEGKSVILGVLATALSLYDFHVDCVCYSSMLSSRDFDDFKPMFEAFKVLGRIRYGTFDTLSEDLLTEQYGDLRKATADFLARERSTKRIPMASTTRVLIIDEVDVFCSEAFFGGAYCPSLTIKNDEIADLMRYIWSLKTSTFNIDELKRHPKYRAVLKSGVLSSANEWLLQRAAQEMDKAARAYSPRLHDHNVRNGKIWYKVEGRDEYVDNVVYSYETNADYLAEFEKGELTEEQMCNGLALHVQCGQFSYAKLPSLFQKILGVTGTLDEKRLPPKMHDVLKSVGIKRFTYCPSMFHDSKRDWQPNNQAYVQVAKDIDAHYHMIVDEIDKRLMPTTQMDSKRSVLVFFRSEEEIVKFRNSSYFLKHKAERQVLTELSASRREDRDHLITRATRQGAVTLVSRMFGRGTDFKINDQRMEKAGGMHVLQTFFSRDLSEEIQIMGRCARQGDMGSYSQVLLSKQEGYDVTQKDVEAWDPSQVYQNLSNLRNAAGAVEVDSLREMAKDRMQEHELLSTSLKEFYSGHTETLNTLIRRYNSPGGLKVGPNGMHIIFCLDESGSMSGDPWDELVGAFNAFWLATSNKPGPPMFASIIHFTSKARITHTMLPIQGQPPVLEPSWGGTAFHPATVKVQNLLDSHGPMNGYAAVLVFMSDGHASDASHAAALLSNLAQQYPGRFESHTVGFGACAPRTLESMAFANGQLDKNKYRVAAAGNLAETFVAVAKSIMPGRI